MKISDYVLKLRNYMEFVNYSAYTVKNYCVCLDVFLSFFEKEGITHPEKINADMIVLFLTRFKKPATHSLYHSAIKLFYNKITKTGSKKFRYIDRPRATKQLPVILSQAEIKRMFEVCHNKKHKAILAILYSCGLRVSELINLKWEHFDRQKSVIIIKQGKGFKDRMVPLCTELQQILIEYWKIYKSKKWVIEGQTGEQYSTTSVNMLLKQLAHKAGISKRIYAHLIRHCSFTHLLENGTDINLIQRIAGHSNVKTTSIYCHISSKVINSVNNPLSTLPKTANSMVG